MRHHRSPAVNVFNIASHCTALTPASQRTCHTVMHVSKRDLTLLGGADCGQPTAYSRPHLFGLSPYPTVSGERYAHEIHDKEENAMSHLVTPLVTAKEYSQRRVRLFNQMQRNSVVVLPFQDVSTRAHDLYHPFKQESNVLYLTGCSDEGGLGAGLMPMLVLAKCPPGTFLSYGEQSILGEEAASFFFNKGNGGKAAESTMPTPRLIGIDPTDGSELVSLLFIKDKDPAVEAWDGPSTGAENGQFLYNGWSDRRAWAGTRTCMCAEGRGYTVSSGEPLTTGEVSGDTIGYVHVKCEGDGVDRGGAGHRHDAPLACRSSKIGNVLTTLHSLLMMIGKAELTHRAAETFAANNTSSGANVNEKRPRGSPPPWYADRSFSALPKLFIKYPTHLNYLGRHSTVTLDVSDLSGGIGENLRRQDVSLSGANCRLFSKEDLGLTHSSAGQQETACYNSTKGGACGDPREVEEEPDFSKMSLEDVRALLKEMDKRTKGNRATMNQGARAIEEDKGQISHTSWPRSAIERHMRKELEHYTVSSGASKTGAPSTAALTSTSVDLTLSVSYPHPWFAVMDLLRSTRLVALRRERAVRGGSLTHVGEEKRKESRGPPGEKRLPFSSGSGSSHHRCAARVSSVHSYSYAFPAAADVFMDPISSSSSSNMSISAADVSPNTQMRRRLLFPRTPILEVSEHNYLVEEEGPTPAGRINSPTTVSLAYYESHSPFATHLTKAEAEEVLPAPRSSASVVGESGQLSTTGEAGGEDGSVFGDNVAEAEEADDANPFDFFNELSKTKETATKKGFTVVKGPETKRTIHLPFLSLDALWKGTPMKSSSPVTTDHAKENNTSSIVNAFLDSIPEALPTISESSASCPKPKSLAIVKDATPLLSLVRAIKTPRELSIMMRGAMVTRTAFVKAMSDTLTKCRTESDIYRVLQSEAWEEGHRVTNALIGESEQNEPLSMASVPATTLSLVTYAAGAISPTLGYIPVVAAGRNALCVHYVANNALLGGIDLSMGKVRITKGDSHGGGGEQTRGSSKLSQTVSTLRPFPPQTRSISLSATTSSFSISLSNPPATATSLLRTNRALYPHQQWVLVDAGAELEGYSCDCSRSWPVVPLDYVPPFLSGVETTAAEGSATQGVVVSTAASTVLEGYHADVHSRLYRTLLHVQRRLLRSVCEGMTIPQLHRMCVSMLHEALTVSYGKKMREVTRNDFKKDGEEGEKVAWGSCDHTDPCLYLCDLDPRIITPRFVTQTLMPHNVGHFIGVDVHEKALRSSSSSAAVNAAGRSSTADHSLSRKGRLMGYEGVFRDLAEDNGKDTSRPHIVDFSDVERSNNTANLTHNDVDASACSSKGHNNTQEAGLTPPSSSTTTTTPSPDTLPKSLSNPFLGGMMLTVEPGLYFPLRITSEGSGNTSEDRDVSNSTSSGYFGEGLPSVAVGMRIEDNLLVLPSLQPSVCDHPAPSPSRDESIDKLALRGRYVSEAFKAWAVSSGYVRTSVAPEIGHLPRQTCDVAVRTCIRDDDEFLNLLRVFYKEQTQSMYHPSEEAFKQCLERFDATIENLLSIMKSTEHKDIKDSNTDCQPPLWETLLHPQSCNAWYRHNIIVTTASIPKDWAEIIATTHHLH